MRKTEHMLRIAQMSHMYNKINMGVIKMMQRKYGCWT